MTGKSVSPTFRLVCGKKMWVADGRQHTHTQQQQRSKKFFGIEAFYLLLEIRRRHQEEEEEEEEQQQDGKILMAHLKQESG